MAPSNLPSPRGLFDSQVVTPVSFETLFTPSVPKVWKHVTGFFAVTGFEFNSEKPPVFNANFGFPLKVFVNTRTGEVKTFSAKFFES